VSVQIGQQTSDTTDDLQSYSETPVGAPGHAVREAPGLAPGQAPGQAVRTQLHGALPDAGVLATLLIAAILLLWWLRRTPRRYPMRGAAIGFTALAAVVVGVLLAIRVVPGAQGIVAGGHLAYDSAYAAYLRRQPVAPLESYVPLYPDATPAVQVPATWRWEATTTAPVSEVATFYQADRHHQGWKVEMSAGAGVVLLRRAGRTEERLRIQAFPGRHTRIEYELRRHILMP
jgi:hypothetical protein